MSDLQAALHHKLLNLTQDEFELLQQKMQRSQKLIINNYLFMSRVKSTQWIHSYKCINNITRDYRFIKIFDLTKLVEDEIPLQTQRIRLRIHKQMLMQTQHIVKCYQLLQNQSFIMIVIQYCNDGILEDKIMDKKVIALSKATQWLKQIIYGLAQLYAQNIYLQTINYRKILLKQGRCKVCDFQNLQRRLTMTEDRLVKRHIHMLGKLFARLVFGLKKVENDQIGFILGQIKTTDMLFGVKLNNQVKEFFELTLNTREKEMISWEMFINLKMFHDPSKSLSNTRFLQLAQLSPEQIYKNRSHPIITISTQLTQQQQKLHRWDKDQYIQYLKTQLILTKMIHPIADEQCYDLQDRDILEILYLITVRCMNNIRNIIMKKNKMKGSVVVKMFENQIERMEKQISKRFYKYSAELTKKESEKLQVGRDWLNIVKNVAKLNFNAKDRKDRFLTGIQSSDESVHDYSKYEQIQFTAQCIRQFLSKTKVVSFEKGHVYYYLLNYQQISLIRFQDLKYLTFDQYIDELINKENDKK